MTIIEISDWLPLADRAPDPSRFVADNRVLNDIFKVSTAWVLLPEDLVEPVSSLPRIFQEIRDMTGWAQRNLADILRTSHTTVGRLESDGRITARSRDTATRATELHAVLVRLARVAAGPGSLLAALNKNKGGVTPLDLFRDGEWSQGYVTALDAIHGPRPAMLGASRVPVKAATRELRP